MKRWDWSRPGSRWSVNCKSDVACRTQRGQESPKERASPEVLLYSDGNSLSRGHKKEEGTEFQGREHGQCKRGSCHLGHPACKYPVAQWMAQVWSSWKQAVLKLPRASYILEPWRGWGLPGSTELLSAGTGVSLWDSNKWKHTAPQLWRGQRYFWWWDFKLAKFKKTGKKGLLHTVWCHSKSIGFQSYLCHTGCVTLGFINMK